MTARHRAASPGPQGSTMGRSKRRRVRWWWRTQIISSSLPLSFSPPSPFPLLAALPYPIPLTLVPSSTFCKYLLNIPVGVVGGGGGACSVSAEERYNTQKSCLKQKAEHLLKRLRGKYVWQLLFTVTVVTVSTAKSKCHHFSICSKTDGPTAIH